MIWEISISGWEEHYHILVEGDDSYSMKFKSQIDEFIVEAIKSKIKKEKELKRKFLIGKDDILKELQKILKKNGFKLIIPKQIGYFLSTGVYHNEDDDLPGTDLLI